MKKTVHHYFDAVENGSLNVRYIADLKVYKDALDELAKTMSQEEIATTNLYQMYLYVQNEVLEFILEV